jgi:hypothetical protein
LVYVPGKPKIEDKAHLTGARGNKQGQQEEKPLIKGFLAKKAMTKLYAYIGRCGGEEEVPEERSELPETTSAQHCELCLMPPSTALPAHIIIYVRRQKRLAPVSGTWHGGLKIYLV